MALGPQGGLEEEESGILDPGPPAGFSVLPAEALSGVALSSQNMKALQKLHPVRQLLHRPKRESKRKGSFKSERTVRQLLGELYVDKEYLEKLLLDEGFRHFVCNRERSKRNLGWMLNAQGRDRACHIILADMFLWMGFTSILILQIRKLRCRKVK